MRVLAAHQPNYLPYSGVFHKMLRSDVFVLLQWEKLSKGSYANSAEIRNPANPVGSQWITIPVGIDSSTTYDSARLSDARWRGKHLTTIRQAYSKSPYFDEVYPLVEGILCNTGTLLDINCALFSSCASALGFSTVVRAPKIGPCTTPTEKLIRLCRIMHADAYLSGMGGRGYLNPEAFRKADIHLLFDQYTPGHDDHGISILDLLMRVGPARARALLSPRSEATEVPSP